MFEDGDDKDINQCIQYWSIFIVKLFKKEESKNRQEVIEKASKLAFKRYELYQQNGWLGLTLEIPPNHKLEEEESEGEEEDNEKWFEFINTEFFIKFNFLLHFVTSSAFQFELFKTIFKTPEIIKDIQIKFPYSTMWPKISYAEESSFQKLNNLIGPAYDFTPIINIPDIILPLAMSSDINEDFWTNLINDLNQENSEVFSERTEV